MNPPPLSLGGAWRALRVPTSDDLVFSAKALAAAALALVVGFSQNLENPYWAVVTLYIVLTPPQSGAVRSKALFRLIGTVGGGLVTIALAAVFGDALGILITALILAICAAMFLNRITRTASNYVWFSGGLTIAVIGLTNLMQPTAIFDYAAARVGEITIGILAIAAVDSIAWPRAMTPAFLELMAGWRGEGRAWMLETLAFRPGQAFDAAHVRAVRQRLRDVTRAVGTIDAQADQLPFDVVRSAPRGSVLNLVRRQVVELIAGLAGVEAWARALSREPEQHAALAPLLAEVAAWLQAEPDATPDLSAHAARGGALVGRIAEARDGLPPGGGFGSVLAGGLLSRLGSFVRDWTDLALGLDALATGRALPPRLAHLAQHARPEWSIDYLAAVLDVAPLLFSLSVTTVIWYWTAWTSGGGALLFSFVGCAFLLGQGQIVRNGAGLLVWVATAFGLVFLYQFAVLPQVTAFPTLLAVLGCAMLPLGIFMTMSMAGMLVLVLTFAFLGLQNAYAADFEASLQTLGASAVGVLIALTSLHLWSYDRERFARRRLMAAVRRDVLDLARAPRPPDRQRFLFLATDRLALYLPAVDASAANGTLPRAGLVADRQAALATLATLVGDPPEAMPTAVAACAAPPLLRRPIPIGDGAGLLARRPDVRQAERQLAAAVAEIGVSTAALYPSITLGGALGTTTSHLGDIVSNRAFHWNVGPLVTWNFPNQSVARAEIAAANAAARGSLAQFDGTVLTALREAETALTALARSLDTERELTAARGDAALSNRNVARLYAGGVGEFLDTLDAERTLIQAEDALATATAQVSQDQVELFMALGGGWQDALPVQAGDLSAVTTDRRGRSLPSRSINR